MKFRTVCEAFVMLVLAVTGLAIVAVPQLRPSDKSKEIDRLREANLFLKHDYQTATDEKAKLYIENDRLRQLLRGAGIDYTPPAE